MILPPTPSLCLSPSYFQMMIMYHRSQPTSGLYQTLQPNWLEWMTIKNNKCKHSILISAFLLASDDHFKEEKLQFSKASLSWNWKLKPSFFSLCIQLHFKRIAMLKQINSNHHGTNHCPTSSNQYSISRHRKIGSMGKVFGTISHTFICLEWAFLFNRTMCARDKCTECLKVDCKYTHAVVKQKKNCVANVAVLQTHICSIGIDASFAFSSLLGDDKMSSMKNPPCMHTDSILIKLKFYAHT